MSVKPLSRIYGREAMASARHEPQASRSVVIVAFLMVFVVFRSVAVNRVYKLQFFLHL